MNINKEIKKESRYKNKIKKQRIKFSVTLLLINKTVKKSEILSRIQMIDADNQILS